MKVRYTEKAHRIGRMTGTTGLFKREYIYLLEETDLDIEKEARRLLDLLNAGRLEEEAHWEIDECIPNQDGVKIIVMLPNF